jgi:hypothetical protein
MSSGIFDYQRMMEDALRGVVRAALIRANETGLPGNHHFYISFRTGAPGVVVPDFLRDRYPEEMTIVLQHQFWGLDVEESQFAVTLSFNKTQQRLVIPFAALTAFADPSVPFGLQFRDGQPTGVAATAADAASAPAAHEPAPSEARTGEKIVTLDAFRKK